MDKIKIGIIGGTGYTGVELLRLLSSHPLAEVKIITSRTEQGREVGELFPSLRGHSALKFCAPDADSFHDCDVVFSATPNGIAMQHAPQLLQQGSRLIDLAADFRLQNAKVWEHWYGQEHSCPDLLANAVYGLPELNRKAIVSADIVANPGCYPTATTLGLLPLLAAGLINSAAIIVDAKSGVTGAGKSANVANLFSEVSDSFKAYAASGHRHHPEISQTLNQVSAHPVQLTFIPHLVPMLRGIHATLYVDLNDQVTLDEAHQAFADYYAAEPFVDLLPLGHHPETRSVKSSNFCRIGLHQAIGSGKLVVLSVIDNLTKGAAGQAVQNMNIMFGLEETAGLQRPALLP